MLLVDPGLAILQNDILICLLQKISYYQNIILLFLSGIKKTLESPQSTR